VVYSFFPTQITCIEPLLCTKLVALGLTHSSSPTILKIEV